MLATRIVNFIRFIIHFFRGKIKDIIDAVNHKMVKGTVVLMKKNLMDLTDLNASFLDRKDEFHGAKVSFQLVSATVGDPDIGNRGKVGEPAYLRAWITTLTSLAARESKLHIKFKYNPSHGTPGAIIVKNHHHNEFYLKTLTLEDFPDKGRSIHFVCNSWVYPAHKYSYDRIFFANDTYLPSKTPEPLQVYRNDELMHLRGGGVTDMLKKHDRVYDYDYYNDLGDPDKGPEYARPVLGGTEKYPYPRRGRTGRPSTKTDPKAESRLPPLSLDIYVPRDEQFGHLKSSDFLAYALKALVQSLFPLLKTPFDETPVPFYSFQDVLNLYEGGVPLPKGKLNKIRDWIPFELIKELLRTDGEHLLRLPIPQVIQEDKSAWRTDEEFAREMLAGTNPVCISRLQEFPPTSKLDRIKYGDHKSSIKEAHIEQHLEGLTVKKALNDMRLFILDHHDTLMPYLNRINATSRKIYASRTLLFLKDDSTLKPLVIELCLPHPDGEHLGAHSRIFTPAKHGVEGSIWQLAKAYVAVNDSGVHQLISHWLNTHAVIEPFVIATNRQLSVMHPIYKLLSPHYRDTMHINALGRQLLTNAKGLIESTVFPGKYSMEMSSFLYKNWKLTEQGLPADLLKRGVAVKDSTKPHNIRLLIEDYPYAVDGLAIWFTIEEWVTDYCSIYYADNATVTADTELQGWWKEVREVGHGDKKDEDWWPEMKTVDELIDVCTTIVWAASALHAAVNFGQYSYAGYLPNRPTISRQFMPEKDSDEYKELEENPDSVFLKTITSQLQTIIGVSLIEILSRHSSDEIYLGQRDTPKWTSDEKALDAFKKFGKKLKEIENNIISRNEDASLKNRNGPVKIPYTLLYPKTSDYTHESGITAKGIPNSISI